MLSRAKNVKNVNYYIYAKHIYSLDGSVGYYTETQQQPFGQRWVLDLAANQDNLRQITVQLLCVEELRRQTW